MAEWCAPLPTRGYECEFVETVPNSLSCPVCLLPFRDPHLLDCCGAKYCAVCIGRVKAAGQPCPLCKEQFTTMLDKSYRRKVLSLMVRCSRKKDGCDWEGELRHLEHHQMEECGVKCRYECGVCVPRPQLVEHELHLCPKRPVDVKLESALTKMEERHKREMDTVKEEFRREMVAVKEDFQIEIERKNQEIAAVKEEFRREMEKKEKSMNEEFKKKDQEIAAIKEEFRKQVDREEQVTEKKLAEQKKEYTSKIVAVKEDFHREIEMKEQEITAVKDVFRREMENNKEQIKKKEQEISIMENELKEEMQKETSAVKVELKNEMKKKGQEITTVKEELKEEIKKKDLEMAALRKEFKRQVERGEQVTEKKLAEQRKEYTSKMKVMEESLVKLTQEMRVLMSLPPCELVMTEYSKHKRDDDVWYSPPFYTGPGGYKMCLRVYANGGKEGAGTHVSVYVSLMKGEHDDKLTWPFHGDIIIQLVNQNRDQDHVEYTAVFDDKAAAIENASNRVTEEERSKSGWGTDKFVSHTNLESTKRYLKNDCIKFRVAKVVVVHSA